MAIETECSADRPHIVEEDSLIEALKKSLSTKLGPAAESSSTVSIFKVPHVLRRHKPEAYEPFVFSIGPIHRDHEHFRRMENLKQWYLKTLLSRMNISLEKFIEGFNEFLLHGPEREDIIEFGKRARDFYEEPYLDHREFMEIMILDGCFVVQLVRKKIVHVNATDKGDPKWHMGSKFQYVCHDLLLLENQLPFFVLKSLYAFIREKLPDDELPPKFREALFRAFSKLKSLDQYLKPCSDAGGPKDDDKIWHILDLIRTSIVFVPGSNIPPATALSEAGVNLKKDDSAENKKESGSDIPPATALSEAGVKFKKDDSAGNLLNIKFENGVLTIPELTIGELTEPLFRNLIAFEQCYPDHSHEITSYAAFMDKLISSDKDIKLLSEAKILDNWLSVEDGSELFNKLYIDTVVKEFQYEEVCAKVNKYYKDDWHKHIRFWRDYCSTPWKVIALIAGILLLVLTFLQTIFTIIPSPVSKGIRVHELSAVI